MKQILTICLLSVCLALSGCATSSNTASDENASSEAVEESTDEVAPPRKPDCTDSLDAKKINRNPDGFIGECGVLYIEVKDAYEISDCVLWAGYEDYLPTYFSEFDGFMYFWDCGIAGEFYNDDRYKVTALVEGTETYETNLGGQRTIAKFTIIDLLESY